MGKAFKFGVSDGKLKFSIDPNKDGEDVVKGKLVLSEALQEAVAREEAVEGAKLVDFKFKGTTLVLKLDTDKDGEELLELEIDLGEAMDEISSLRKKD